MTAPAPPAVSRGTLWALAALLLGAAVAAWVLWLNDSPLLPATHADGVKYLSAAVSLAEGGELADPVARWSSPSDARFLSHFPPGYPLALAALIRAGLRPDVAALWLTVAGAAGTAGLVFLAVGLAGSAWAGTLAVVLFFAAPSAVLLHGAIWSEPLFLPTVAALVGAMALRPRSAGLHGAVAGLGVLVRYAGVAGVVAAGIWAWRRHGEGPGRVPAAAMAVAPGTAVLIAWGAVVTVRGEPVRSPGFYAEGLGGDLVGLMDTVGRWLAPLPVEIGPARWAAALVVGAAVVALWAGVLRPDPGTSDRDGEPPPTRRFLGAAALFAACYAAAVLLARLVADRELPFDARIFAPVFLLGTMGTVLALQAPRGWRPARRSRWTAAAGVAVGALWIGGAFATNLVGIPVMKEQGRFYTAWVWFTSDVVEWVEGPSRAWSRLYSNEPWLLHFQTGRTPRLLPTRTEVGDWSAFQAVYRERPGPIVVLYPLRSDDLPPEELEARLGLGRQLVRPEGVVLVPTEDEPPTPASPVRGALR